MKKIYYTLFFQLLLLVGKAQCPQVLDYLNNPSTNPYWISCTGGDYVLNFQSPTSWGAYSISWGDASPNHVGANYVGSTIITHTYTATVDTFPVILTIPSLGCSMVGVVVMEQAVNAAIMVPPLGSTIACAPGNFQLINLSTNNSQTTKYQWDFGDATAVQNYSYTNQAAVTNHTYAANSPTCQTMVTLKAWNYCSFTNTSVATLNISIFEKDNAIVTTSASIKCWPESVFTFSANSTQNCTSGGNNFQRQRKWHFGNYWTFNNNNDSIIDWTPYPPVTTASVAFPNMGNYQILLLDSNVCGVDTAAINVNIFNAPVASMAIPPSPYCTGATQTFSNLSTVGANYKWDFGEGPGFFTFPPGPVTYSYASPGTYTVAHVAFLPFHSSCFDTTQMVINVLPSPTASFNVSPMVGCDILSNVTFTNFSVGGVSYNWDLGNTNSSILFTPPPQNYTLTGEHNITLTVTAANGCTEHAVQTVTVYPTPTASFTAPNNICKNAPIQFTDQSTASSTLAISNYTWSFGDSSPNSTSQNPVHTYTNSGSFTVSLIAANPLCASSTFTQVVIVNPTPTVNFVPTSTAGCTQFSVNFSNTTVGGTNYQWNFGDSSPLSSAVNASHTFTNVTPTNLTYTVKLVGTSAVGCKDSISKTITVFPLPKVDAIIAPTVGCSPLAVSFTNTGVGSTGSIWNFDNGQTSTLNVASTIYTLANAAANTTFSVKLVAVSINGCKDSLLYDVLVYSQPAVSFTSVGSVCSLNTLTLSNLSAGASSYTWTYGSAGSGGSTFNGIHQFVNPTSSSQTSLVSLTAESAMGCTNTFTANITVFPQPSINIIAVPDTGCATLRVTFPTVSGATNFSWTLGNGNTSSTSGLVAYYENNTSLVKNYSVQLIGTDANGCADTAYKTIRVFPKPNAYFEVNPTTYLLPDATVIPTNLTTGATTYNWFFGDGGSSNIQNPVYKYKGKGDFYITLIARSNLGCTDTFKIAAPINVLDDTFFEIPNAFTPNQSGSPGNVFNPTDLSNDIFHPNLKGVEDYQFTIYSRWGEVMFDTKNINEGWDGYYKGKLCTQDVYVWKIVAKLVNGDTISKTGDVTLLR